MLLKVLLVEDKELIRRGLHFQMDWAAAGCTVVGEASNGKEGLAQIKDLQPDVVITDIRMPDMDGLEMLAAAQNICEFDSVILSGYGEFDYAKKAISLGVTEYFLKPVDLEDLAICLKKIALRHQSGAASTAFPVDLAPELKPDSINNQNVAVMLRYIQEHYPERISLTDLSQKLNFSCTHLNAKFKAETGYTFHDYLNYYRISQAVKLQQRGDLKLYEIAERVGFADYKYFNKVYKKYVGYAPNKMFLRNDAGDKT